MRTHPGHRAAQGRAATAYAKIHPNTYKIYQLVSGWREQGVLDARWGSKEGRGTGPMAD